MWSNKETWGSPFINYKGQFETFLIDYEKLAARNFFDLGHVVKNGVREIVHSYRLRGIAATRVSAVCHSMGGLITRQFFADKKGVEYFRKDNFGPETIHFAAPPIFGSFFKYCETTSQAVADYIFDILNRDRDLIDYFAPKLPKPIIQDPATGCK